MPDFTISGSKVGITIELTVKELELWSNNLFDQMELEIFKMRDKGYTRTQANNAVMTIFNEGSDFMQTFNNKMDKVILRMENDLVAKPTEILGSESPKQKFKWVLGAVLKSCTDCLTASKMEPRTIEKWREVKLKGDKKSKKKGLHKIGLPREGLTICSYGCKCLLKPI